MEIDQKRIEDAIIGDVSEKIIDDEALRERVKKVVDARIDAHFKKIADAQIQAAVEAAVTRGLEHEYCRINSFGQIEGSPTTVKAELERMIGGYWSARVGKDGKESASHYGTVSRAEWLMTKLVAADFQGEMKQHIINLGGSLKDKLRGELHDTVNKLLSEVFHVNSLDDRELKTSGRSCIDPEQTKASV